jgi:glycosyltransferase involved in cell wall biosynthesis
MHVTVVLCTWNRSALLRQALSALTEIDAPVDASWDVVVVDNASTDHTQDVLRAFANRLPLTIAVERKPGLSNARNCGLDHARGDYVLWTDDDVLVDRRWLVEFVAGVRRHPDASVFGGRILPWFPVPPDAGLLRAFPALEQGFCAVDHQIPEGQLPADMRINGANMAFRTSVARALRFDPNFGPTHGSAVVGDERDLIDRCKAEGHNPIWLPRVEVRHYVAPERMTLAYLQRYYRDWATTVVRREGVPAGSSLLGVPRWIPVAVIHTQIKALGARLRGRRDDYLVATREHAYMRGLLAECWRQARGQ